MGIARALLKKADFYFFDEATSAIDSSNEEIISKAIRQYLDGKTLIYIAHRLGTVMKLDNIAVVKDGKVAEIGSHNQLISTVDSQYSELWRKYQHSNN